MDEGVMVDYHISKTMITLDQVYCDNCFQGDNHYDNLIQG